VKGDAPTTGQPGSLHAAEQHHHQTVDQTADAHGLGARMLPWKTQRTRQPGHRAGDQTAHVRLTSMPVKTSARSTGVLAGAQQ
jgi:hypothetical protein